MSITRLPFEEVFADESGGNIKTPQSEFLREGKFPVVDQGKALIAGYVNEEERVCGGGRPAIVFGDHTRCVKYIDHPFCMGADGVKVLRPKIDADLKYLYYYLRQLQLPDAGYDRHFKYLKRTEVVLLPLPEQRRIAAILDKADALRTKRREALAQLDRLAQSIFVEMFGDLFINSKGFPVSRLGDVCDVRDGTHDSPSYVAKGYPLVTSKNLRDGKIDLSGVNFITEADYDEINRRSKVDVGDILMPMIGTIGNPVLVEQEPNYAIKNMALIKFKPTSPNREFVLQFLRGDCFDRLVASKNKGGTQKFLALGEIRGLPLPVPLETSQKEFFQRMQAIKRNRKRYEEALDGTDNLFASLQHRAFQGEL